MNITFIGLGIMGKRMAKNLLSSDATLTVWNRSPEPKTELGNAGAKTADTANEAVAGADLVISMLSTPEAVTEVFLKEGGTLFAIPKGATWIDCSTVNPGFSQHCQDLAEQAGRAILRPSRGRHQAPRRECRTNLYRRGHRGGNRPF